MFFKQSGFTWLVVGLGNPVHSTKAPGTTWAFSR